MMSRPPATLSTRSVEGRGSRLLSLGRKALVLYFCASVAYITYEFLISPWYYGSWHP